MKDFIEKQIIDIDQDILDFSNSLEFGRFSKIMNQLYLDKLKSFHFRSDNLETDRMALNIYLSLPDKINELAELVVAKRRKQAEVAE